MSYQKIKTPYKDSEWLEAEHFLKSINHVPLQNAFKIPKALKIILPRGLEEQALESLGLPHDEYNKLRLILIETRVIMDEGITKANYISYFHYLLWWEEIIAKINLRKYNMSNVKLEKDSKSGYWLEVPGLAEKRPSLMRGDRVYIRPKADGKVIFESIVKDLEDDKIRIADFDERHFIFGTFVILKILLYSFSQFYNEAAEFDVRFMMCRVPLERMHKAVSRVFNSKQDCRVFPEPNKYKIAVKPIPKYYNSLIESNEEQISAVEHIVAGTSGFAPYIVFGPPGTGKTMTIVEAIIQLVLKKANNRILVCTNSNMAADHIALMLLNYNKRLNINNFILRANSQTREWTVMPTELHPVSNGTSYENFYAVDNHQMASYRIVVTTLSHAAKYSSDRSQRTHKLQMSHLFIDEAAQASEPEALIPITGLLAASGKLVLAGDPKQLGPVCISKEASKRGLGKSLLQRLKETYDNLYENDPNYITVLVKNFRSDPDILKLPNQLFYDNNLQVYKMKAWLIDNNHDKIQVGTVEAFQGKEKRVILVSTVRANCKLLDYDAKYGLGFLVDDKRFNVALTRAKAKIIIVGNPACLTRDVKWRLYIDLCDENKCYLGKKSQQLERNSTMLNEIAKIRFDKCRMTDELKAIKNKNGENK
ncbi:unnamed protein product [Diatraea saccharalis]|uniref:RNA helicase n=1 Tax=Diatraea saccharalis TaxID=40085 RepID=A0A9N9R425_9NEOP|nr:unnamed protein product [Diatraea saccharalis]